MKSLLGGMIFQYIHMHSIHCSHCISIWYINIYKASLRYSQFWPFGAFLCSLLVLIYRKKLRKMKLLIASPIAPPIWEQNETIVNRNISSSIFLGAKKVKIDWISYSTVDLWIQKFFQLCWVFFWSVLSLEWLTIVTSLWRYNEVTMK